MSILKILLIIIAIWHISTAYAKTITFKYIALEGAMVADDVDTLIAAISHIYHHDTVIDDESTVHTHDNSKVDEVIRSYHVQILTCDRIVDLLEYDHVSHVSKVKDVENGEIFWITCCYLRSGYSK